MQEKSQYNAFAKNFSQTRTHAWPEFELVEDILQDIFSQKKKGEKIRILDIGCGNGRLFEFLPEDLKDHIEYIGADISEGLLDQARIKYIDQKIPHPTAPKGRGSADKVNPRFVLQDFGDVWKFEDNSFDLVVSIAAFHHLLDKKSQKFFLSESHRVLKNSGEIFLTTWIFPKKHFWANFWRGRVFTKNWNIPFGKEKFPRTYRQVTGKDLNNLLSKNNFRINYIKNFRGRNFVARAKKSL